MFSSSCSPTISSTTHCSGHDSRQSGRTKALHLSEIHWQLADGDRVTTYKTYHGTHEGPFLGVAPTQRKIHFETVDVMRVRNGKITDHWGVANLLSLMQQIGGWIPPAEERPSGIL
jgi:SnoaL-like polyketide cyclase